MARKMTQEDFEQKVFDKYGSEYSVIGRYINNKTPVMLKHNICGTEWDTTAPVDFMKKNPNRCPQCCTYKFKRKTNEEFLKEVYEQVGNEYIFLEEYKNKKTKLKVRHNIEKCMKEYEVTPNSFLSNKTRCPYCCKNTSKGENYIANILDKNNIKYNTQKKLIESENQDLSHCLKFDFFIEEFNLAIEFDGEQHFRPKRGGEEEFRRQKERDKRKDNYCKIKGIRLLRIPYTEDIFNSLESYFINNFNIGLNKFE